MPVATTVVELRKRVAGNVRRFREQAELTQAQLAERAGLVTRHLQKVEAGSVNATFKTVASIAQALGIDVAELFANGADSSAKDEEKL